jgi:hypothetical protein
MSRAYAVLRVSPEIYATIRATLIAAGYQHALHGAIGTEHECLDLHGILLQAGDDGTPRRVSADAVLTRIQEVIDGIRAFPASYETRLTVTKLQEAQHWWQAGLPLEETTP